MKKHLLLLIGLFFALLAKAQDSQTLFQLIESESSKINTMECTIDNVRIKSGEETKKHGTLLYQSTDKIATNFSNGDHAIFNGNKVDIDLGIFHGTFRTNRKNVFNSLTDMLFSAIQGKCRQLIEDYDYDFDIETKDESYIVNCYSRKRSFLGIGYKQVSFIYGKDDYRIKSIIMTDYNNVVNRFTLSNIQYGKSIDANAFKL